MMNLREKFVTKLFDKLQLRPKTSNIPKLHDVNVRFYHILSVKLVRFTPDVIEK